MGTMFEKVKSHLEKGEIKFLADENEGSLFLPFKSDSGNWVTGLHMHEDRGVILCYSTSVVVTPKNRIDEMAKFMADLNFSTMVGNWELDRDDGETRFKTTLTVTESELDDDNIMQLIAYNHGGFNSALPSVMAVALTDTTAENAYAKFSASDANEKEEANDAENLAPDGRVVNFPGTKTLH